MPLADLLNAIPENEITASTGVTFYDRTYPVLLAAGEQMMAGIDTEQAASILALGLAGWNRGPKGAQDYGRIVENRPNKFNKVINAINQIINLQVADRANHLLVDNALMSACELLKGNDRRPITITEPSKFLHFLAPNWLPILDSNVAEELEHNADIGGGKATWEVYITYTAELWRIGFFNNNIPNNNLRLRYQRIANQAVPQVSALRVIDSTLFNRARHRD